MKAGVAHPAIYTHPMVAAFPHVTFCYCFPITCSIRNSGILINSICGNEYPSKFSLFQGLLWPFPSRKTYGTLMKLFSVGLKSGLSGFGHSSSAATIWWPSLWRWYTNSFYGSSWGSTAWYRPTRFVPFLSRPWHPRMLSL